MGSNISTFIKIENRLININHVKMLEYDDEKAWITIDNNNDNIVYTYYKNNKDDEKKYKLLKKQIDENDDVLFESEDEDN